MACRYTYQGKTYEAAAFDDLLRAMPPVTAAQYMPSVKSIPNAPFVTATDKWLALAIKRVIKMAVDGGYDKVSFINGEQSAERYSLDKQVETIKWRTDGKTKIVSIEIKETGKTLRLRINEVGRVTESAGPDFEQANGKPIDEIIGKDAAQKVMDSGHGVLSEEGLKFEQNGMRAFYDKIVPNTTKDVLRKLGGGQMEAVEVQGDFWRDSSGIPSQRKQLLEQSGFTITPAMREKAADGLPLFKIANPSTTTQANDYEPAPSQQHLADKFAAKVNAVQPNARNPVVLHAVSGRVGGDRALAAIAAIGRKVFGHEVVFVRFEGDPIFNGAVSKSMPGVIFIRVDSDKPHMAILGHELLHKLSSSNPTLYKSLVQRLKTYLTTDAGKQYAERFTKAYEAQKLTAPNNIEEEMFGDIVGDNFMDAAFWSELSEGQPGMFKMLVNAITKFLNLVSEKIKLHKPFGTEKYLKDIDAARSAIASAMREFSETQVRETDASTSDAAFSVGEDWRSADSISPGNQYQMAGAVVDGREVRDDVPNMSSISSSLDDYTILKGVREVPMSDFTFTGKSYSVSETKRIENLADRIKESVEINPLIVVIDKEGSYILEGAHRGEALHLLGAKSFPAVVVVDNESLNDPTAPDSDTPTFSLTNQTDTPAFKQWFGESVVTDTGKAGGKPRVVYHGTAKSFNKVNMKKGAQGLFWMTTDKASIESGDVGAQGKGAIMPLYASIENPAGWKEYDQKSIGELKRDGYDGIILPDPDGSKTVVIFEPTQVKSATKNNGDFSDNPDIRFSLAAGQNNPRPIINAVVEHLNDRFQAPGTLNWWHKTIGTQYNLAQRSEPFKRVFNAVQNFINDTSYYATEAATLAPKLLPKLESWKDIIKSPISAQDSKAIAAPIFEGTLTWKRLSDGQLARTDEDEMGGVVFTADELKDKFKLTDGQIALYQEFRASVDKSLTNLAISSMLKMGGADVAPIAEMAMAEKSASAAADMLSNYLGSLAQEDPKRSETLLATGAKLMEIAQKNNNLQNNGYAPLTRFGNYTVDIIDDGKRVYFGMFESKIEANQMVKRMTANYPDASIRQGTVSQEEYKMFAGVTPETLELFGEMMGLDAQGGDTKDQVFQEYLKAAKANRSAMKRLIHRKGIAGFSEDAGRVLAGFVYSNARQTSTNLHSSEITKGIADIPQGQGEVKDAAIKLADYVRNPQEEAQALRGLMFAQYIGGSVASAIVNLTQPFTMTLPWLSQYGGIASAGKQMARATRDALKENTGDKALDEALLLAIEKGIVSPQEVYQLQQQASGAASLKSGDGTRAGDLNATISNSASRIMLGWGKLFGVAEQFNRRSTFIAAWRTAVEQKLENPFAFAEKAIYETQGIYAKSNKPAWARGAIGSTLFTFKQFSIAYVEMIGRMVNGPNADTASRMAAVNALAILALLSGVAGLPGGDDLDDIVSGIGQAMGYNFDSKAARRDFLEQHLGAGAQQFIERGISGLAGVPIDVSGRLSMGNLIPGTGLFTRKTDHTSDVVQTIGPVGDLAKRAFDAAGSLARGEVGDAAKSVMPLAGSNVIKAFDMANMGMYRDKRGNKVIDTDGTDAFFKGIGFQPNDVKRVQDATGEVQRMVGLNKIRETEIADNWAQGLFEKDAKKTAKARQDLLDWNEDNPTMPIRINYNQIFKRLKSMNETKQQRIQKTMPKEIRATMRREMETQ